MSEYDDGDLPGHDTVRGDDGRTSVVNDAIEIPTIGKPVSEPGTRHIDRMDAADIVERICGFVLELETAFVDGMLSDKISSLEPDDIPSTEILTCYLKLVESVPGPFHHLRVDAVRTLLSQFRSRSVPTTMFAARLPAASTVEDNVPDGSETKIHNAIVATSDGSQTKLRIDQIFEATFWGIGLEFPAAEENEILRTQLLRRSVRRLAGDIRGLRHILERFRTDNDVQKLKIVSSHHEKRFEHLMLDILNEKKDRASFASIYEDFLEKTDLRVRYSHLRRKGGARVQVTSITSPGYHRAKIDAIKLSEEYVFLSPLTLASAAVAIRNSQFASFFGDFDADEAGVWAQILDDDRDVGDLAFLIKEHLFAAMKQPRTSPAGPVVNVHPAIRHLIRAFVEDQSIRTTTKLRIREGELAGVEGRNEMPIPDENPGARLEDLNTGDTVTGRVVNIVSYGAFVRYGLIDGLLHISKIPGATLNRIDEMLEIGNLVEVRVGDIDLEKGRLSFELISPPEILPTPEEPDEAVRHSVP